MDESPLSFGPVPLRSRRDGWTPERQRAFILFIAAGLKPGRAAARLGMRRQGAYELRTRRDGESFAAAWDAAAAEASRRHVEARSGAGLYARAVEGVAVPIRHRRRIVAIDRRYDNRALVRLLGIVEPILRKAMNGGPGLNPARDAEILSAFDPKTSLPLDAPETSQGAIRGGTSRRHPLEDVCHSTSGVERWTSGSSLLPIMPPSR